MEPKLPELSKREQMNGTETSFRENPKIVEFPKNQPFNQKSRQFRGGNQMEQKFPVGNFQKLGYASRDSSLFRT